MTHILSNQWLARRRPHWDRLQALLGQADSIGLGRLSRAELQELALLYRQVAADLSVLRQDTTARTYATHVNQLLARAHHIIYSGRKTSIAGLFRFLRDEYPRIFQNNLRYVAASLIISLACGALGLILTNTQPEFMRHFLGPRMIATMERHEMWTHSIVSVAPMETSAIMTNNLSVSFLTFAGGITFGLFTLFSLFNNGMMLGVIGAACHHYGMSLSLWSFVAAHGSLELPSIIIAGAAGLRLGHAMLFPAGYRWKDSVARGGIEATRLVSGIIPLLVIAGCLEGFFSPSQAPVALKFTVGAMLFTLLNLWLFRPLKSDLPS
ncbi:stage II sporulation protein M [Occallatibacter riparius]|uniref:Stage II sporulation protein M n=1 Tax=Occallatibacter riparius TaxID=1002689 RepID=A0A9J7BTU5_9BACT|nr:stage II sporulation protein M [Occallatibacter riparius]UWZ84342.1 stage II sporulation protein M [Occallatibacter riparius]